MLRSECWNDSSWRNGLIAVTEANDDNPPIA
jgi:hypothetical protein